MNSIKEWLLEKKDYFPWALVVFLFIFNITGFFFSNKNEEIEPLDMPDELFYEEESEMLETEQDKNLASEKNENVQNEEPQHIFVDVKGAVEAPGVYEMKNDERVVDLVAKAEGFSQDADVTQINLAQKIEDQMMIYIPREGEIIEGDFMQSSSSHISEDTENQNALININRADLSSLMTLNGIGEKKAQSILDYREENGSFQTIEDIKNISGIGDKTFENLKDSITVSD